MNLYWTLYERLLDYKAGIPIAFFFATAETCLSHAEATTHKVIAPIKKWIISFAMVFVLTCYMIFLKFDFDTPLWSSFFPILKAFYYGLFALHWPIRWPLFFQKSKILDMLSLVLLYSPHCFLYLYHFF